MSNSSPMKMPEWLMLGRTVFLGALLAESLRVGFLSSKAWGEQLFDEGLFGFVIVGGTFIIALLIAYGYQREAHKHARRVLSSRRIDLALLLMGGGWIDCLLAPQLARFHNAVTLLDKGWSQAMLAIALVILMTPVFRPILSRPRKESIQLRFVSDIEIEDAEHDSLGISKQAADFADTVLSSAVSSGMVFGVDAPWGIGKTSFLNIAARRWAEVAAEDVIVFRFEPLRYASEPDLAVRFIKDLCGRIRQEVFAPEFLPAATRYSKMLKGKADVTFLGIKLSLEPSSETLDELLGDIDVVLEQIGRRLIVIVDDLDRLEPTLVNNVLFTVRRTFKLTRATYILCYDTEVLVAGKEEGSRARQFLEKFITTKLSLFIDLKTIQTFLKKDWHADPSRFQTIPGDVMFKLNQITGGAAELLASKKAHNYVPLLGDLRKVKRFVNAVLLMNVETVNFERSDFHRPDFIHLVLLHLFYPGLFRQIYAEETEGRIGSFSVRRGDKSGLANLTNAPELANVLKGVDKPAEFLLKQLFDVDSLEFHSYHDNNEELWRTRACFNFVSRNLENYLQLIVRLKIPEATDTFRMYQDLLTKIKAGDLTVFGALETPEFALRTKEETHEKLWQLIVSNAYELGSTVANEAISALITWLPRYSMVGAGDRSMRQRLVYTLVLLLDRAGFGEPRGDRIRSSSDVVELADLILGDKHGKSSRNVVRDLTAPDRGPLGFEDVMLLRLSCCADRLGQVHNIYTALLRYEDPSARGEGDVSVITQNSMRRLSQQIFQEFKSRYILAKVNFFVDVDRVSDSVLLGEFANRSVFGNESERDVDAARSAIKSFVIYQLTNRSPGNGSGIGCGFYDESEAIDGAGIHNAMCRYLLDFCFNPQFGKGHALAFGDYCLRAFRDEAMRFDGKFDVPTTQILLTALIGRGQVQAFWTLYGEQIKLMLNDETKRTVVSYHYKATYAERLPLVFEALDQLLISGEGLPEQPAEPLADA